MNRFESTITREQLDRFVDGEMNDHEYRSFLARLEQEPDGWRRCALCFLEHQAWERDLRRWADGDNTVSHASPPWNRGNDNQLSGAQQAPRIWSLALSLMLVGVLMGMGVMSGRAPVRDRNAPIGSNPVTSPASSDPRSQPARKSRDRELTPATPVAMERPPATVVLANGKFLPDGTWGMPILEASDDRAMAALRAESSRWREWEDRARKLGRQVRYERQYTPVQLEDGRQMVIPWDNVEIVPVSTMSIP